MTINMTDGTFFQRENSPGGGTYTTIAQVMNITPPKKVRKTAEVYIHDQSAPVVKTGAYEAMEAVIELAVDFDSSGHQQLFSDQDAKTSRSYQIVFPNTGAAQWRFDAIIKGIETGDATAEGTDPQKVTVTFALAAAPAITW